MSKTISSTITAFYSLYPFDSPILITSTGAMTYAYLAPALNQPNDWTLTNAGLISGALYNANNATDATVSVANSGTISGIGVSLYGANISLTNLATGKIISAADGLYAGATDVTVSNAGTITADANGLDLKATNATIANSGTITGGLSGISLRGRSGTGGTKPSATLTNTGNIRGTSQGIYVRQGSVVINNTAAILGGHGIVATGNNTTLAVTTKGLLSGTTSAGFWIQNGAEASITNKSGGVVTAVHYGVYASGSLTVLTLQNDGLMDIGSSAYGVKVVRASANITNSGQIMWGKFGIAIQNAGATITNSGSIFATSYAIQFAAGYTNLLRLKPGSYFNNKVSGGNSIGSSIVSTLELMSTSGVGTLSGFGSQIFNFAAVTIDAGAQWGVSGSMTIASGMTLVNAGTLSMLSGNLFNASTITNTGVMKSGVTLTGSTGVLVNAAGGTISTATSLGAIYAAGSGTVSNAGLISNSSAKAVYLFSGGTVTNTGTLSGAVGVKFGTGGSGSVVNSGSMTASASGIYLRAGGFVSNAATGVISASYGVQATGTGAVTLRNAGSVTGTNAAVKLASGNANRLIVDPGAVFSGLVDGGNSISSSIASTLELASGSSTGTLTGLGSQFVKFRQVTIDAGAQWTLAAGSIGTGYTIIDSGTLTNTGTLQSGVTLTGSNPTLINTTLASISVPAGVNAVYAATTATVSNAGLISGNTGSGAGVDLNAGGLVPNQSTGTISGLFGVVSQTGATLWNAGLLSGSTVNGAGAILTTGGQLTNQASGIIAGYSGAAFIIGAGTVSNAGRISGDTTKGSGLFLASGGQVANLTGGTISGYAAITLSSTGTVANAGLIAGGTAGHGYGVQAQAGGTITNEAGGTISGHIATRFSTTSGTVFNAGLISGGASDGFGVFLGTGGAVTNQSTGTISANTGAWFLATGTLWNAGLISAGAANGVGVVFSSAGQASNQAGGIITGYIGVALMGSTSTLSNAGLISGNATSGAGVVLAGGSHLTNLSGGTISGSDGARATGTGAATVFNAGSLIGTTNAVDFYAGSANRLIIAPGAVFVGTVDGGNTIGAAAASTLELASAASAGTLNGLGTQFVNFSQITIDAGATWALSGTNLGASYTIGNAGTLINTGTLGAAVTLTGSSPALINAPSGTISPQSGLRAVYAGVSGTVINAGLIAASAAGGFGIVFRAGGLVTNQASGTITGFSGVELLDTAGTILNAGLIRGDAAQGSGVLLLAGGELTNHPSGTISGYVGAAFAGGAGTLRNAGLITGNTSTGYGLFLAAGGTVTNQAGGTISGHLGAYFKGGAGTLRNAGRISGATTAASLAAGYANRVILDPGAVFAGKVDGGNSIGASIGSTLELASAASAGTLGGFGLQFIHFATISVDIGAQWTLPAGSIASGYRILDGGTLTNTGTLLSGVTLTGSNPTLINATGGTISTATSLGAVYAAGSGTVSNAGLISNSSAKAIYLFGGGSVTNTGTLTGVVGVKFGVGGSGSVVNSGTITGTNNGVYLRAGGFVSNAATGVISGNYGVHANGTGAATLRNAGTITGTSAAAVSFGAGNANRLIVDPGAVFSGLVDGANSISSGIDSTLELASGSSTGTLTGLGSQFVKFRQVTIDAGAQWTLAAGSIGTGYTIVDSGTLTNTGTLQSGVTLAGAASALINTAAALITGQSYGVRAITADTTMHVANAGSIFGGVRAVDVRNGAQATVTNQSGGTLSGGFGGVVAYGSQSTLTLQSAGRIIGTYVYGVLAMNARASITNTGSISGASYGIYLSDAVATVTNAGAISGYRAVYVAASTATISNQAGGSITGNHFGVRGIQAGTTLTLDNAASISGTHWAVGVQYGASGTIINQSGGTLSGSDGGVVADNTQGTLTLLNAGLITGSSRYGVSANRAATAITNTGTISGTTYGVRVQHAAATIRNAGQISGGTFAGWFAAGYANRLILDAGASFSGMVTGGNSIGASIVSTLELAANSSSGTLTGLGSQFINFGQVLVDAGAVWTLGGTNSLAAGTTLENDGTLTVLNGSFDSDGTVQNDGLIVIDPSTLTVGALIGTGTIEIAASSTLIVEGTVSVGETIVFTGLNGWLSLQPYQFAGLIDGFVVGETIDLAGVTDATSATIQDGNTLEVQRASHAAIQLRLDPNLNYTNTQFRISTASDLAQPDFITVEDLACFCAGTRIATPDGETPVEHLQIGDLVRTANGATARVRWLGRQTVSTVFADPLRVKPIRIKAGALDEATPVRDLLVSPDHALLVGDILVQAGALVNGISIVRETAVPEVIVYYHVETADHTLILAEGAPAETFIDNIDRLGFDNWAEHEALHPESAPIAEMYLPRAKSHRQVPRRIRELLMVQALTLSGRADRVA